MPLLLPAIKEMPLGQRNVVRREVVVSIAQFQVSGLHAWCPKVWLECNAVLLLFTLTSLTPLPNTRQVLACVPSMLAG